MDRPTLRDVCRELEIPFTPKNTIKELSNKIRLKKMSIETKEGNITQEQITEWKKKFKTDKLHKLTVKDKDGNPIVGYLKPPGREIKATALSMYSQNKILECGEFIRDNCWLGGDERLKMSGDIADTAAIQASGIIKFLEAELGEV
ncbi:hypothetical protein CLA01_16500 [Chryseobacterium lathyri]|uniref:Uncharacterized protein n=2 Tax=Chryseobacterium lathyri TaxID=395933 RepID=A0A511Y8R0_9FLAO|nr:hypothetical protein CLA01_16500 [Chryseobacterium lathyri]